MIEIIFLIIQSATFFASMPQVIRLIKMKQSEEFCIFTWSIWFVSQFASMIYVVSIKNFSLILVNVAWVLFYAVMIVLIIKYRNKSRSTMSETTD
ncbi:MAG TPA: PQ-loop domain-containing transporter [Candidatus Saccharibacteria bacterium]|nr:PQ-loop domain-containing transporter [Candidatus Saccharibacteria bacterium]